MRPGSADEHFSTVPETVASEAGRSVEAVADCRTCAARARCISYGWMSPGGLWFENAVVLRPPPGCRGFVGRGEDIRRHFGEPPNHNGH